MSVVLVGRGLEGEGGEALSLRTSRVIGFSIPGRCPSHDRDVERRRQEVDDGVDHRLDALVVERRSRERRLDLPRDGALSDRGVELGRGHRLPLERGEQDLVGELAGRLDHCSRYIWASSRTSAGISDATTSLPRSPSNVSIFIVTRWTTPRSFLRCRRGS